MFTREIERSTSFSYSSLEGTISFSGPFFFSVVKPSTQQSTLLNLLLVGWSQTLVSSFSFQSFLQMLNWFFRSFSVKKQHVTMHHSSIIHIANMLQCLPRGSLPESCVIICETRLNLQRFLCGLRIFCLWLGWAVFPGTGCPGERKVQMYCA